MKKNFLRLFLLGTLALSDLGCWYVLIHRMLCLASGTSTGPAETGLLVLAVLLAVCFAVLRQGIFQQLDDLEDVTAHWGEIRPEELKACFHSLSGPVGGLGDTFYQQMARVEEKMTKIRAETAEETERAVKAQIVRSICRSALPQRIPYYPSQENYASAGIVRDGWKPVCAFYDTFYIDPGLLCVAVGQVSDHDVSDAMFMTVAQATIRSRLRLGRSLAEAMADVNRQMYDLGSNRSAAVLVGTLDTSNGRFSYVNAGGCPPLVMRNEEDYQREESPVFAALAQNQSVTYRTQELRLRQGDRIFLHTVGLSASRGEGGVSFGDQELRPALNRSRTLSGNLQEQLRFLANEAEAFCAEERDRPGFAALILEFRKGDKELAHCRVAASPENRQEAMDFLKRRFEENGIQPRRYAQAVVLAEELFSLCCQSAKPGSLLSVECGVAPDGESTTLRFNGFFGGKTPLRADIPNSPAAQSAAFIKDRAEFTKFKAGKNGEQDTATVICFLS